MNISFEGKAALVTGAASGLGPATATDIEIRWPLGLTETLRAIAANQLVTVREGQGIVKGRPFR